MPPNSQVPAWCASIMLLFRLTVVVLFRLSRKFALRMGLLVFKVFLFLADWLGFGSALCYESWASLDHLKCYLNNPVSSQGPWSLLSSYGTLHFCDCCVYVLLKEATYGAVWNRCWECDICRSIACDGENPPSVASGLIPIPCYKRLGWVKFTCYRQWPLPLLLTLIPERKLSLSRMDFGDQNTFLFAFPFVHLLC